MARLDGEFPHRDDCPEPKIVYTGLNEQYNDRIFETYRCEHCGAEADRVYKLKGWS